MDQLHYATEPLQRALRTDGSPERDLAECLLDLKDRSRLKKFFSAWIQEIIWQREMRRKLLKTKYLLGRLELNRLFASWKNRTRYSKMLRVKEAIVCHSVFKKRTCALIKSWRQIIKSKKVACAKLDKLTMKHMRRIFFNYLNYIVGDQIAK